MMKLPPSRSETTPSLTRLCAAIADRITFRCTLIQTGTESYRYQATAAEHIRQGA